MEPFVCIGQGHFVLLLCQAVASQILSQMVFVVFVELIFGRIFMPQINLFKPLFHRIDLAGCLSGERIRQRDQSHLFFFRQKMFTDITVAQEEPYGQRRVGIGEILFHDSLIEREEFITDALAQCPDSRFFGKTIGCTDKFLDAFIKFPAQFRCDRCIVKDLIQRIDKQFDAMV